MAGPSFVILLILLLVLLGVIGLVLLIIGKRGRRVSEHPHCRKCKFDLYGVYPGATGTGGKCPECGSVLAVPKAVQSGLRKKRMAILVLGAFLLCVSVGVFVASGVMAARRTDLNPYKPTWMLSWEVNHRDSGDVGLQLKELISRMNSKQLPAEMVSAMVARALAIQADSKARWVSAWGDLIEAARVAGAVSDEQLGQYGRNAVSFHATVRPHVALGDNWVFEMTVGGGRAGSGGTINLVPRLIGVKVDGETHMVPDSAAGMLGIGSGGAGTVRFTRKVEAAPGEHAVTTHWAMSVKESWDGRSLKDWEEGLDAGKVIVMGAGESTVTLVDDPSLQAPIEQAFPKDKVKITVEARRGGESAASDRHLSFQIKCESAPMTVAFDVFLRRTAESAAAKGAQEWKLTTLTFVKSTGSSSTATGGDLKGFDEQTVDVVLRPSAAAAQGTVEITQIWNGEIVIPDVSVKWAEKKE